MPGLKDDQGKYQKAHGVKRILIPPKSPIFIVWLLAWGPHSTKKIDGLNRECDEKNAAEIRRFN